MAKKPTLHPYADKQAFERLMLLIATLVRYPGIGGKEPEPSERGHRNALQAVQQQFRELAQTMEMELPEDYPATPTLRKDLETLRRYGILDRRMYRWGYYLGTGALDLEELRVALGALASQAKYQGNPQARRIYKSLEKRLRGLDLELKGELFYPVRQQLNRAIVYTDPEEMMERRDNRHTLFHNLDVVEQAIVQGQAIEVCRTTDPYGHGRTGFMRFWPLQLIYHDIAWYLIFEYCENGHLAVGRVNRFSDYCKVLSLQGRGLAAQEESLQKAHKLLENGWGLYLGDPEEQQAELQGNLQLETFKVRFFGPTIPFILEGERRHLKQKIEKGPKDKTMGKPSYADYTVTLPNRSCKEFLLWVLKHGENAQVLSPPKLVEQHRQAALALAARYSS